MGEDGGENGGVEGAVEASKRARPMIRMAREEEGRRAWREKSKRQREGGVGGDF